LWYQLTESDMRMAHQALEVMAMEENNKANDNTTNTLTTTESNTDPTTLPPTLPTTESSVTVATSSTETDIPEKLSATLPQTTQSSQADEQKNNESKSSLDINGRLLLLETTNKNLVKRLTTL